MKSPNWKEEEIMLVLELYLSNGLSWANKIMDRTIEIIQMSLLLE